MSKQDQIEYLIIRLQRTDAWINSSDTKTSIIFATMGVLLAILLNDRTFTIIEKILNYTLFFRLLNVILVYAAGVYIFLGILFLLKSLTPKLDNSTEITSLHYFGDVSTMSYKRLTSDYKKRNLDEEIMDLLNQIHVNSKICKLKHDNLKTGINHSTTGILLLIVTLICNYLFSSQML